MRPLVAYKVCALIKKAAFSSNCLFGMETTDKYCIHYKLGKQTLCVKRSMGIFTFSKDSLNEAKNFAENIGVSSVIFQGTGKKKRRSKRAMALSASLSSHLDEFYRGKKRLSKTMVLPGTLFLESFTPLSVIQ